MRTRLFVDFWNFSLNWNSRAPESVRLDWPRVPRVLLREATRLLGEAALGMPRLEETRVYASFETHGRGLKLRQWLDTFLDRQPGFSVFTFERRWRKKAVHCRNCQSETERCPTCNEPFGRAVEKSVDASIVTDLLSLAWDQTYDLAILVSSDSDFVPVVRYLQAKNIKVVNATWDGHGFELATESWASLKLDDLMGELARSEGGGRST